MSNEIDAASNNRSQIRTRTVTKGNKFNFTPDEDSLLQKLLFEQEGLADDGKITNENLTSFCKEIASQLQRHPIHLVKRVLELRSQNQVRD